MSTSINTGEAKVYNVEQSKKNQSEYCKEKGAPHFAPGTGTCWSCKSQIYEVKYWKRYQKSATKDDHDYKTGVDVESSKRLVTGCPHCNKSYCD